MRVLVYLCECLDICKFRLLNLKPPIFFIHWLDTEIHIEIAFLRRYIFISVISC